MHLLLLLPVLLPLCPETRVVGKGKDGKRIEGKRGKGKEGEDDDGGQHFIRILKLLPHIVYYIKLRSDQVSK